MRWCAGKCFSAKSKDSDFFTGRQQLLTTWDDANEKLTHAALNTSAGAA
jgi:hypothetical protein